MYRNITTDFWTDSKVEQANCDEKLLMLYLLTAPQGNLAGCYEVTYRRIEVDTGIKAKKAEKAMGKLAELGMVEYSAETNEVLILNCGKHNWSSSNNTKTALEKQIEKVKNAQLKRLLIGEYESHFSIPYPYPFEGYIEPCDGDKYPYVSVSVSVPESVKEEGVQGEGDPTESQSIEEIVDYLNSILGTRYQASSKKNRSLINARLNEGFTVDDFKAVIDKKTKAWKNDPKMAMYLRPETLFGTKFEGYLNEITVQCRGGGADDFSMYD